MCAIGASLTGIALISLCAIVARKGNLAWLALLCHLSLCTLYIISGLLLIFWFLGALERRPQWSVPHVGRWAPSSRLAAGVFTNFDAFLCTAYQKCCYLRATAVWNHSVSNTCTQPFGQPAGDRWAKQDVSAESFCELTTGGGSFSISEGVCGFLEANVGGFALTSCRRDFCPGTERPKCVRLKLC